MIFNLHEFFLDYFEHMHEALIIFPLHCNVYNSKFDY